MLKLFTTQFNHSKSSTTMETKSGELPSLSKPEERNIYLIVASTPDGVIGNKGEIPWKSTRDMSFFRKMTTNIDEKKTNCVLMGNATFKSLKGRKLPKRKILCLSKSEQESDSCFSSVDAAIKYWREKENGDLWICGGSSIYDETISRGLPQEIFVTWVNKTIVGDTKINVKNLTESKIYEKHSDTLAIEEQSKEGDEDALELEFSKYIRK